MSRVRAVRGHQGVWINSEVFREEARHFEKYGYYTADPAGSPDWMSYWTEQRRRCIMGYTVGGVKITGDHYFYLNFCPILKTEDTTSKKSRKIEGFPDFWDGDYNYFWSREIARHGILDVGILNEKELREYYKLPAPEEGISKEQALLLKSFYEKLGLAVVIQPNYLLGGWNIIVGKSRRKGYSFKNAAIGVNNYNTRPRSLTMYGAYEKKFLYPKGIFTMAYKYINFLSEHTAWAMPRDVINQPGKGHVKASYIEYQQGVAIEKGFMSEIMSVSFKDDPDAARGKDAYDLVIEEAGAFGTPGLLKDTLVAINDIVMDGDIKTGLITVFGCVCAGTKVWNNKGQLVNIEDITKKSGIIGYASKGTIQEKISWLQPPAKKECVRITTEKGNTIECSVDHPLLWTKAKWIKESKTGNKRLATFKQASEIKVGDKLLECLQVPNFGTKKMWQPRLVGMMIGDGYYGGKHSSGQLCISEKELLDYLDENNIKYVKSESKSSAEPFFEYVTIKHTQEELRNLGIQGQSGKFKRLPANIWEYDKNSIAELIAGYFDADGYVGSQGKRKKLQITSVVKELLEEVKVQLYKLGVQSNIYERRHSGKTMLYSNVTGKSSLIKTTQSWSLEICDLESIRNFKKHIHLKVKKKQAVIDSWDLSKKRNEPSLEFEYVHTIEKGDYFISNPKLENLKARTVTKVEFIGEKEIYNLSADYTHTYITNGFISHNTSGDMEGGTADYADMHEKPAAYGFMPFQNIWDEDSEEFECGFFHPIQWNMPGYYDKQGNSDQATAVAVEKKQRKYLLEKGATSADIQKRMQEKPTGPKEAFGAVTINNFPVLELKRQLEIVKAKDLNRKMGTPVKMFYDYEKKKTVAQPILDGTANVIYRMKPDNLSLEGTPVIYEYPCPNTPKNVYRIGYDPYRQQFGTSLSAIIVYKPVIQGEVTKNVIVAEYVGRPYDPDDVNYIAFMFADLYNTQVMHENEVTHVKDWFRKTKRLHYLAAQPDAVISANIKNSLVSRVYGCHMNEKLKDAGEKYIKQWLLLVQDYDEFGNPIRTIDRIYSVGLLEELIAYHRKGNFDRIMALMQVMFQDAEVEMTQEHSVKSKGSEKLKKFAEIMAEKGRVNKNYGRHVRY